MREPNSNVSVMVHDNHIFHGTQTMFQDMILGDDETIIGDQMGHDVEMVLDYKMVDIHGNQMVHNSEMIPGSKMDHDDSEMIHYDQMVAHGGEMVQASGMFNGNDAAAATQPTISTCRRKRSVVWEHFTTEVSSEECTRACCMHCKKTLAYSSGSKIAGTSHLKRHIDHSCPVLNGPPTAGGTDNGGQEILQRSSKRRYANVLFDQDHSLSFLAKMIILHDYPLHITQQPSFISFVEGLQPRFKVANMDVMEAEVYAVYLKERDNLFKDFGNIPGRINLTVGRWTTSQTLEYVSLAGQFIDSGWKLHRRMLNFVMVPWSFSESSVSEAVSRSLPQWNMNDKLFTITVDHDSSSHDIYSANLRDHLSEKNIPMFGGQLFVVRCYSRILNAAARDVIASVQSIIYKLRESIKFIKSCPTHDQKFSDIVRQLQIPSTKILCLDIATQWNTTYLMLLVALDYSDAFTMLERCDDNYNQAPSTVDWKNVEVACKYLKLFYDSAQSVTATADPTANIFFHEAWTIQREISVATDLQDPMFSGIGKGILESFDKYWKDSNVVLAIAVVMDPRFKMKIVEFSYSKLYGVNAAKYVKVVDDALHELFKEYVTQALPLTPAHVEHGGTDGLPDKTFVNPLSTGDELSDFDSYLSEVRLSESSKSELDQYLEEALVPRMPEFDILEWWKLNALKYPTLSRMARDVLAIPVSVASSGSSIFSDGTEARALDDYQSSLRPETMEALFCAKDWLQHSPTVSKLSCSLSVKK